MERLVVGRLCHGRTGPWPPSAFQYQSRFVSDTGSPMSGQSYFFPKPVEAEAQKGRPAGAVKRSNPKPHSTQ